jgi:TonB family protein
LQGTVVLSLVVSDQGRPQNLKVVRSLGLGLDERAIEAVEQWRFKPGMKDGEPVPVMATIEVNFRLRRDDQLAQEKRADEERMERLRLANVATEQARQAQIAQAQAIRVDFSKVKFLVTGCGEPRGAVGVVSREIDLSSDEAARHILNSGAIYTTEQCPRPLAMNTFQTKGGLANIVVELRRGDPTTFTEDKFNYKNPAGSSISRMITDAYPEVAAWGRNYDETQLTWGEYRNIEKAEKDRIARQKYEADLQKQRKTQQKQASDAQAKAIALKEEMFFKRAGSRQIVGIGEVCQNPFPYVGKVIVFALFGTWQATSSTSALLDTGCGLFHMTQIPVSVLTPKFNGTKVIALKVLGKTQGTVTVQYVYHELCALGDCKDFPAIDRR